MEINQLEFKKWTEALYSGKYKQTTQHLNDKKGFCCLGVACEILIPEELIKRDFGFIRFNHPIAQAAAPKWLKEISDDVYDKTGVFLTQVNDGMKFTFPEIAMLLEFIYIHKAL